MLFYVFNVFFSFSLFRRFPSFAHVRLAYSVNGSCIAQAHLIKHKCMTLDGKRAECVNLHECPFNVLACIEREWDQYSVQFFEQFSFLESLNCEKCWGPFRFNAIAICLEQTNAFRVENPLIAISFSGKNRIMQYCLVDEIIKLQFCG